jgi:hypothetical protein
MDQIRSHRFFSYYQYSDNIQLLKNSSHLKPSISSTTPENGKVSLSWSVSKGGHPITSYKIYVYNSNNEIEDTIPIQDIQTTSYTIQGLSNNVNYRFKVVSVIHGEKELSSEEVFSTPSIQATAPSAPQIFSAMAGNKEVTLEWSAPSDNGGSLITSYKIYVYDSNGQELTNKNVSGIATLSTTVSGLDNGTTYTFKVSAFNETNESEKSQPVSYTPFSAPSAPTITSAESGNVSVLLRWSAPSDNGGYPITSYNVYVYSSTGSLLNTIQITNIQTTSTTVSGLTNGTTYKFKVSAVNQIDQTYSNEVSSTPATRPSAPQITSAAPGNASVLLQWSDPSNNGGSTITSYKIYVYSSTDVSLNTITGIATRSRSVTGLTNETTYKFKVSAVNSKGESLQSDSVSSMPGVSPSAPTITSATAGIYSASLAWSAPSNVGSSAISSYKLYVYLDGVQLLSKTVSGITNTSYTLQNLLYNAGNYTFKVSAINGAGEGSLSSASSNVQPTAISNGVSRSLNTDLTPTFSYLKDSNNNDIIFTKSSGKGWVANVYMSNLFGHPMYSTTKNRIIFKVEGLGFNGDKVVYLVYDRNIASTTNRYLYIKKDDLGQAQISTISPSNTNIEHLSIEYTSTDSLSLFLFNKNHTVLSQTIANASVLTQDYWHRAIYNVKVSVAIQYTSPTENDIFYNSLSYIK